MIEQAIFHKPETEYAYAKDKKTISLRLRTAKEDVPEVDVVYGGKYNFAQRYHRAHMTLSYTDRIFNYYVVDLELEDVRLVYVFEIREGDKVYYFSEDGLTDYYDFTLNYYNAFQIAYINETDVHKKVEWMEGACFYQIFVDRFNRGDYEKDDSYINMSWSDIPNPKSFAGGDLKGITEKLGYLKDLGINALYLTPVFKSISNHKYDIEDYYTIDEMFGSKEDFAVLVKQAHKRGIRIVMDAVFNHVSDRCAQFQDVIKNGKESKYYDWFVINGDRIDLENVNYECFAACEYMPKWNTSNSEVQKYLIDIAVYWIEKYKIDGWRLDVSDEVSHSFWRKFRETVKKANPECVIIGENWHNANPYLHGDQYDSIMNYAFTKACLDFFVFDAFDAKAFAEKLNELLMRNTDTVNQMMLNLLDSHDTHRFLTQLNGDEKKLESALAVLYMYIGAPCIYYGTEIGMEGGYDPDCRRPMDWRKTQEFNPLTKLIKQLASLKKNADILNKGEIRIYAKKDIFYLERRYENKKLRLILNGADNAVPLRDAICTNAVGKLNKYEFMIEYF